MQPSTQAAALPPWLRLIYCYQTVEAMVGAERMSYVDEGSPEAPPLLLVHGNPTWSLLWRNVIPQASKRFRVIAPDNVGFGLSSKPEYAGYHTLERHIENLTALVDSLGLRQVTIAAIGWGGPIALGYATRHAENVARILLMNTWVSPWSVMPQTWHLRLLRSGLGPMLANSNAMISPGMKMLTARPLAKTLLDAYAYPFSKSGERSAMLAFARMHAREARDPAFETIEGIAAKLPSLRARVEILWGTRDPVLKGKVLPYLLRDSFGNAGDPKLLPQASHLVPEDDPTAVVEKILEVFKPKPAAPMFNILR